MDKKLLAIVMSDIHFSHSPPVARSAESNWYEAMERPWEEIYKKWLVNENPPIIIAGDIFDHWSRGVAAELINFVIDLFEPFDVWAIPGQHDLPNHNYDERFRSPYMTLHMAGVLRDMQTSVKIKRGDYSLTLHPFPWGKEIAPCPMEYIGDEYNVNLAVCHKYIWKPGHTYPGADESGLVSNLEQQLKGYDAAVFGDNHSHFTHGRIFNCGTFYRRKSDEIDYRPTVGLLWSDGSITPWRLDIEKDKFFHKSDEHVTKELAKFTEVLAELRGLGLDSLDFRAAVNRFMEDQQVDSQTKNMVLEAVG